MTPSPSTRVLPSKLAPIAGVALAALLLATRTPGQAGPPLGQGRVAPPPPAPPETCTTPAAWIPKLVSPGIDANGNYVEDSIEALPTGETVDVILACNACPDDDDLGRFVAAGGTVTYASPYVSDVLVRDLPVPAAIALGSDPLVAMVFIDGPLDFAGDVDTAAMRVTHSEEFAGINLEDAFPNLPLGPNVPPGAGITIAVIDSGIDGGHESLPLSKFVGGIDFTVNPPNPTLQDPDDVLGHGTAVAGVAAGVGGAFGARGVAPGARLVDIKVGDFAVLSTGVVVRAIDECVAHRNDWSIDVINISIASARDSVGDDPMSIHASRAVEAGLVVVAGMGNAGLHRVPGPAAADGVIAVANVDVMGTAGHEDDVLRFSSNTGPRLDDGDADDWDERKPTCAAPGTDVLAPIFDTTTGYAEVTGTSFSAPHVAGVAALLLQVFPLSPKEVHDRIAGACHAYGSEFWEPGTGHGLVDAFRARFGPATELRLWHPTASRDGLGRAVAVDGTRAVVGAPLYGLGAAFVFDTAAGPNGSHHQSEAREPLLQLLPDIPALEGSFGAAVAIDGNVALVANSARSAWLFDVTTGDQLFKLDLPPGHAGELALAIDGGLAVVGSKREQSNEGAAYVFEVATGEELFELQATDAAPADELGAAVALDGTTLLVGAPGDDPAGSAYVFDLVSGDQVSKISAPGLVASASFGKHVALDGGRAVISGTIGADATAFVFDVASGQELARFTIGNGVHSLAIEGDTVVAGNANRDWSRQSVNPRLAPAGPGSAQLY